MKILVLPGDGIGPEITAATLGVLHTVNDQLGLGLEFETHEIGLASLESSGSTLPEEVVARVTEVDGVLLGPVSHYDYPPRVEGGINPSGELRTRFKLYSNIRPCRSRDDLTVLRRPMDLIIVRENTEGFYSDRSMFVGPAEFMPDEDTAFSIRKITAKACSAVAQTAFELASNRRRKVTAVHKANVVKLSDGLFLREVRKVAEQFPDVQLEELIVDATAAALIRRPDSFDVIVTTNMFGDILSDEASELSGSLGLGGSISVGGNICVAQAHTVGAGHRRPNVAVPTSSIMSASMLLHWLGQRHNDERVLNAGQRIEVAVEQVLEVPASRTRDVGGTQDTDQFCASVIAALQSQPAAAH